MSLANGLPILFILSKNQVLALLIFVMVSFVSFALYTLHTDVDSSVGKLCDQRDRGGIGRNDWTCLTV